MDNANPYGHDVAFKILLRTPDDLVVLTPPSWFTVRHLGTVVVMLLLAMLVVGARAWFIDRTMRAQIAALGYLGNRRGSFLKTSTMRGRCLEFWSGSPNSVPRA